MGYQAEPEHGAHVTQAYDPSRASALARAWVEEATNGLDGDFGDLEHLLLSREDKGQFLASYRYRGGPSIGMCYQTGRCGWQPPYGVRERCDASKPWLHPLNSWRKEEHNQLENVMGLSKPRSAGDRRPLAASTYAVTRSLRHGPGHCEDPTRLAAGDAPPKPPPAKPNTLLIVLASLAGLALVGGAVVYWRRRARRA